MTGTTTASRNRGSIRAATCRRRLAAFTLLVAAAVPSACARGVNVQPPPTPVYAVSVINATGVEIVVSYDDGSASRALGTVLPGRTERFVIAAPASTNVEILSRAASGDTTFRPVAVALVAGQTVELTVR